MQKHDYTLVNSSSRFFLLFFPFLMCYDRKCLPKNILVWEIAWKENSNAFIAQRSSLHILTLWSCRGRARPHAQGRPYFYGRPVGAAPTARAQKRCGERAPRSAPAPCYTREIALHRSALFSAQPVMKALCET